MKKLRILGLVCAWALFPVASHAVIVALDFNDIDTFTPNFTTNQNGTDPSDATWSISGGINGTGGIVAPNGGGFDRSAVYNVQGFDLTGQKATISMFVKDAVVANGNARPLQLGFIDDPNKTFNGTPVTADFVSIRIRGDLTAQLQYAIDGATSTDTAIGFNFAAGDWLKLTIEFQLTDAVAGTLTYSYLIDDYGQEGTDTPVNVLTSGLKTVTNAGLASVDFANMFAGFRSNEIENPGFDNFLVDAVPEPGSATLAALAGTMLLNRRRRRR